MSDSVQPVFTVAGIRGIENRVMPSADPPLMERAGRAAAEEAFRLTMERPGRVLIVCGPGNNGGDGLVMARRLLQAKREVTVVFDGDLARLPADAAAAYVAWRGAGGKVETELPPAPEEGWALIADALFGIGLERPLTGHYAGWIESLNSFNVPRLAIDIPSGIDADTGKVLGTAFRATHTLTFIALKPGLLTLDGPDHVGNLIVRTLDIDIAEHARPPGHVIDTTLFRDQLKPRLNNSHKGDFGEVGVIGGARGMNGAALLAARAALKLGAGRVLVSLVDERAPSVDLIQPELMLRTPEQVLAQANALAVGPGLGLDEGAHAILGEALALERPLVLDADALTLLAQDDDFQRLCHDRSAPTLITPHPGEAGRLLGTGPSAVQHDRVGAAVELAKRYRSLVLLKGCGSVIALPDQRWLINTTGHPGMASGGMGDVLSGLLVALLAQRWPAESALLAATHLHGAAADRLAREGVGPIGLTAGEVCEASRGVFNGWIVQANQNGH